MENDWNWQKDTKSLKSKNSISDLSKKRMKNWKTWFHDVLLRALSYNIWVTKGVLLADLTMILHCAHYYLLAILLFSHRWGFFFSLKKLFVYLF